MAQRRSRRRSTAQRGTVRQHRARGGQGEDDRRAAEDEGQDVLLRAASSCGATCARRWSHWAMGVLRRAAWEDRMYAHAAAARRSSGTS